MIRTVFTRYSLLVRSTAVLAVVALIALGVAAGPRLVDAQNDTSWAIGDSLVVNTDALNLRSDATTDADVIAVLATGDAVTITGNPIVSLLLTSTHTDGAFFVYLEDVDENGKVTYLTEGELRALHRRISSEQSPLKLPVPYHSFLRKDAMPLVPGQVAELRFGLQPISVLVKKGHRLRVAIAGHDKDTFIRIPAEGTPMIAIQRNSRGLSRIELPVIKR